MPTLLAGLALAGAAAAGGGDTGPPARPPGAETRSAPGPAGPELAGLAAAGPGGRLALPLADGRTVAATVLRRRDHGAARYTLSGSIDGAPAGRFVLAVNGSALRGVVRVARGDVHRLRDDGAVARAERVDVAALPACSGATPLAPAGGVAGAGGDGCDDGSEIDVLVLYTVPARLAVGGVTAIEAEIDMMIEDANAAFSDSGVDAELRLVFTWEVVVSESVLNLTGMLQVGDGLLDGIHALRDAYGADLVAVVRSGGGGSATSLSSLVPGSDVFAFSINGVAAAPLFVLAHEIGHNLGACHAIGDGGGCPEEGGLLFPFSSGHRFVGESGTAWRTVMAYIPGERIGHFSNPEILFDGQPTGVPAGEPEQADNAQTINASAAFVAGYRCRDETCVALDLPSQAPDCDGNGLPDACEIAAGLTADVDADGAVDECECRPDTTGDGQVDAEDLAAVLAAWGQGGVPADATHDGVVDVDDLLSVLLGWGGCDSGPVVPPLP